MSEEKGCFALAMFFLIAAFSPALCVKLGIPIWIGIILTVVFFGAACGISRKVFTK